MTMAATTVRQVTPSVTRQTSARDRADVALAERPPGVPGADGWAYSRTWCWRWTRGEAYMMQNLDWSPDVYAGVVDDFGRLVLVGWTS